MNKQRTFLLVGCGVSVAIGVFVLGRTESREQTTAANPADVASPAPVEVRGASPCDILPGVELAYQVNIEVRGTVHAAGLGAMGQDAVTDSSQRATLHLRGLEDAGTAGSVVMARIIGASLNRRPMDAGMSDPFLLRIGRDCAIEGYAQHARTSRTHARQQQSLAHELMWHLPRGAVVTAQSDNAIGHYEATYQTAGDQRVQVSVSRYTRIWSEGVKDIIPVNSSAEVVLGATWFERLQRQEQLNGLAIVDSDTSVQAWRVVSDADAFAGVPQTIEGYTWLNLLPQSNISTRAQRPVTKADLQARARVQHQSVDEALGNHVARTKAGGNFAQMWPPLSAYLEAHPEQTQTVVTALMRRMVPSHAQATAWVAVGQARTPEAREALTFVMRDERVATVDRTRAMFAMSDREDLGEDHARELGTHSQGLRRTEPAARQFGREAALALGVFANLRVDDHPEIYTSARETMVGLLAGETSSSNLHTVFAAMGNLGDPSLIDTVRPYFSHPDARVRAGAMQVFRRLEPELSSPTLAEILRSETDPKVKRVAYEVIARQTGDAQRPFDEAVLQQAANDLPLAKSVLARRAIIKTIGPAVLTFEPAREALRAQARTEYERRSGVYSLIAQYMPAEDASVLAGAR